MKSLDVYTSGDENHLCGASLRENHKIRHAHGIDYHHMHQWHGAGTPDYSGMSVSPWLSHGCMNSGLQELVHSV
jgi:hypothetical protein